MKRIDYFWPRTAFQISGIVLGTQVLTEAISTRREGFEWVFLACSIAFALSCAWSLFAVVWNAIRARGQA